MPEIGRVNAHKTTHQDGGSDELDLTGMSPGAHKTTHQDGGADELDLTGLTRSPVFVDRGDPAAYDWVLADFTTDATWRDLDLSSIVPSGAIAVLLRGQFGSNSVGTYMMFRKNGNSNEINVSKQWAQVSAEIWGADIICALDANRVVEYKGAFTFITLNITVAGWWI